MHQSWLRFNIHETELWVWRILMTMTNIVDQIYWSYFLVLEAYIINKLLLTISDHWIYSLMLWLDWLLMRNLLAFLIFYRWLTWWPVEACKIYILGLKSLLRSDSWFKRRPFFKALISVKVFWPTWLSLDGMRLESK